MYKNYDDLPGVLSVKELQYAIYESVSSKALERIC